MGSREISEAINAQREFFNSHKTRDLKFRLNTLRKLHDEILKREKQIYQALYMDMGKPLFEAYVAEVGFVLKEIKLHLKKLKGWSKMKRVGTSILNFPAKGWIYPEPYGVVLIMAPWNFPFLLVFSPLIGAISAGNCAILKPSEFAPHTGNLMEDMIGNTFSPEYITLFQGGLEFNRKLLLEKFDYIFFTGSSRVGKIIMENAARNLTPITLELGGKNPCIVDEDAPIDLSAKRIIACKGLNAGQHCLAPDYVFIHSSIKAKFMENLKTYAIQFWGENLLKSPDFTRIVNYKHFDRLLGLIDNANIYFGGTNSRAQKLLSMTIIDGVKTDDPIMEGEIFGPLLPILEFNELDEVIGFINSKPEPLALYYFSNDNITQQKIIRETKSGAVCINDTVTQFVNLQMPFGGVGNSGMGAYHGKFSFDTFSHYKPVMKKANWLDIKLRYSPYVNKTKWVKRLYRW